MVDLLLRFSLHAGLSTGAFGSDRRPGVDLLGIWFGTGTDRGMAFLFILAGLIGLSAGGQITMPLDKAFWGDYFGMLTDKFGIQWMVSYAYNQQR